MSEIELGLQGRARGARAERTPRRPDLLGGAGASAARGAAAALLAAALAAGPLPEALLPAPLRIASTAAQALDSARKSFDRRITVADRTPLAEERADFLLTLKC